MFQARSKIIKKEDKHAPDRKFILDSNTHEPFMALGHGRTSFQEKFSCSFFKGKESSLVITLFRHQVAPPV